MNSDEIGWYHPVDESNQWDGFNDPGIETFAGKPIRSLAREVIQNALDAKDSIPVRVQIRNTRIKTKSGSSQEFEIGLGFRKLTHTAVESKSVSLERTIAVGSMRDYLRLVVEPFDDSIGYGNLKVIQYSFLMAA